MLDARVRTLNAELGTWNPEPLKRLAPCRPTPQFMAMPVIERMVSVQFRHQVHFTQEVFSPENPTLRQVMDPDEAGSRRALVVVDEAIVQARPQFVGEIENWFRTNAPALQLVCPPVVMIGGEAVKNAYFRVSE